MNNLNFLVDVLKESPVFKTLEKNVKPGRTVCASGLSTINKSNIIYALCRLKGVTAFCLASDEKRGANFVQRPFVHGTSCLCLSRA